MRQYKEAVKKKITEDQVKMVYKKVNLKLEDLIDDLGILIEDNYLAHNQTLTPEMKKIDEKFDVIYKLVRENKELIEKLK